MADAVVARPSAAVPEPAVSEANSTSEAESQVEAKAAAAAKAKHAHSQSQSQPRKVRFNVGSNYKVLEIIGEGVSTKLSFALFPLAAAVVEDAGFSGFLITDNGHDYVFYRLMV